MLKKKLLFLILVLSCFLFSSVMPESVEGETLRGAPFADPSYIQKMPEDWETKSIIYDSANENYDLVVSLNQQFFHFLEPIIEEFAKKHGIKIFINNGTCGISAGVLGKKTADIAGFCCPPGNSDRLPGLEYHTIGIHPISILVHPDNPTSNLTLDQVRQAFQGDIYKWSELEWKDIPIQPIARLHCKKRPGHWRLILDNVELFSPSLQKAAAIEDMFNLVSASPGAIGYEVMWLSEALAGKVKPIKINGYSPDDLDNLLTGKYPFYRALYLSTWNADHLAKPTADKLIKRIQEIINSPDSKVRIVSAARLKDAGWKFKGDELVGEPN